MNLLYVIPIVLLPNTAHLPTDTAVGVSVAALVLAALLGQRDSPALEPRSYLMAPLAALFLAMLVGFLAAHWRDVTGMDRDLREAKVAVLFPLLYWSYRRSGLDLEATRKLVGVTLVVAVLAGTEAVVQGMGFNLGEFSDTQRATGPFGPINMANRAGVFFAMFLPFLVALALQPGLRRSLRVLAVLGSLILAAAILFTYSRQAYLIGLFVIMVLLVWRSIPAAVVAGLVLAAAALLVLPKSVVDRVQDTQQVDVSGSVSLDVSTSSRFVIWNGTLDMVRDHPGGVGLGRFAENIGNYTSYEGKDAHNGFLLTLAECGPLGLLALLWVFWRLWRLSRWLRHMPAGARSQPRAIERGFTLAIVAMALGNLYGSPFFDSVIMANFWILCGLMERYGVLRAHAAAFAAESSRVGHPPAPVGKQFPLAAKALPGLGGSGSVVH